MQLILTNPTERDRIRMRQDAENDWITYVNSERKDERLSVLIELVKESLLSAEEAAKRINMSVAEFESLSEPKE